MITGEQGAGKLASPVREEADGKGPKPRAPRRRPTSLDREGLETEQEPPRQPLTQPTSSSTVRPMSIEVEAVRHVTDELVEACRRLLPQLSSSAAPLSADDLARVANHQANTLFVARSQGAIVGMLTLVTFPLPSGLRARIEDVVVDQDARGQGVGTALTMAALALAQQQGARSVDLTSRASRTAANRLYQQLGFQLRDSNVYRYQPPPPAP
jgi:ribosomal protein S18 acetylase RimI-like enzyme